MIDANLRQTLEHTLSLQLKKDVRLYDFKSVAGGCINYTAIISSTAGDFFIKINDAHLYPDMFECEARGLDLLSNHSKFSIPEVLNYGVTGDKSFLVLSHINTAKRQSDFWEDFGIKLAQLHRNANATNGLDYDNYIGSLKQINKTNANWTEFFIEQRLKRQLWLATNSGKINQTLANKFEQLFKQLDDFFPAEPPALLHGDLWSGNFIVGDDGYVSLFDPAVYYGHREMELAYTSLFGGFEEGFYETYHATYPLEDGFEMRKDIYNLYPLLVHVNLFGGNYLRQVDQILQNLTILSS